MTPANGASPTFSNTVDVIRSEHLTAARSCIRNPKILQELEAEIEHDCDGLRSFLFAAQVTKHPCVVCIVQTAYAYVGHRRNLAEVERQYHWVRRTPRL